MILIPILLLALLVMLAGLFMCAKAKKEELGRIYCIASWVATGFGILVFVFGITAGILMACYHCKNGRGNGCESEMSCPMMMHGGMDGHCSKMMNRHGDCEMGGGNGCSGHNSSCEMKVMGAKCEMMEMDDDDDAVKEIIIKKMGDGENGAEVKVEVDKKPK